MSDAGEDLELCGVDLVHYKLRKAILTGELAPNLEVSQVELARRLNVGRTPLREAVRMLQRERLIDAERHRRVRVAPFSLDDLEQLYALRIITESFALRRTVPRLTASDFDRIEQCLAEMEDCQKTEDVDRWEAPHERFHLQLVSGAGERIVRLTEEMIAHSERYRRLYTLRQPRSWAVGATEHDEIVDACRQGDADLAAERLARHLSRTALTVVTYVEPEHDPAIVRDATRLVTGATPEYDGAGNGTVVNPERGRDGR